MFLPYVVICVKTRDTLVCLAREQKRVQKAAVGRVVNVCCSFDHTAMLTVWSKKTVEHGTFDRLTTILNGSTDSRNLVDVATMEFNFSLALHPRLRSCPIEGQINLISHIFPVGWFGHLELRVWGDFHLIKLVFRWPPVSFKHLPVLNLPSVIWSIVDVVIVIRLVEQFAIQFKFMGRS